jgi:Ca2+/H+ antiporter
MKLSSLAPESKVLLIAGVACCVGGLRMTHLVLLPDHEETSLWFLFGLLSALLLPMNKGNREGFGPVLIWACFSGCLLSALSTGNGGRITYLVLAICLLVFVFLVYYAFASHQRAERHETGSNER